MGYERTVSADGADLTPETVWEFSLPEIRFGQGAIKELPRQLSSLGTDPPGRGLIVTDPTLVDLGHADRVTSVIEDAGFDVDVFASVEREPSIASVDSCIDHVHDVGGYDVYLGLGGGSCLDTAKATRAVVANGGDLIDYIAEPTGHGESLTRAGPPLVCIPTTAGTGAEISPLAILSVEEQEIKEGISDSVVRADAAVLDPRLTVTLPPELTAATAMDALGHAIEGYTTHRFDALRRPAAPADRPVYAGRTPVTEMFSERAIRLLAGNVRNVVHNGDDVDARAAMLKGALFGAIAGLTAGAHLCHAMAYPVGNRYHTFHGETIAVLTPASTLGYNLASDPERFARIARMLGASTDGLSTREAAEEARREYVRLQQDLNVLPNGLSALAGIDESAVDWLAERTVQSQKRLLRCNPRPVTESDVREVFVDALHNWE